MLVQKSDDFQYYVGKDLLDFTEQLMYPCVKHIPLCLRFLQSDNMDDWIEGGPLSLKGWLTRWFSECEVNVIVETTVSEEWGPILSLFSFILIRSKSIIKSPHLTILPSLLRFLTSLDLLAPTPSSLYLWLLDILPLTSDSSLIALSLVAVLSRTPSLQNEVFVELQKSFEKQFNPEFLQILACLIDEGHVSVNRIRSVCDTVLKEVRNTFLTSL